MPVIRSIAFPFQEGDFSFPRAAEDFDAIKASIIQIVCTGKGERIMRPDFGCGAFDYVFENDSDAFRLKVEREIRMSLAKWEPRIRVDQVQLSTDAISEPGQIVISVYYTVVDANYSDSVTVAGGG